MNNRELKVILVDAKNGEDEAVCKLLDKYKKLIHTYSFVNGELKEDLKQDLICETIDKIKKFKI